MPMFGGRMSLHGGARMPERPWSEKLPPVERLPLPPMGMRPRPDYVTREQLELMMGAGGIPPAPGMMERGLPPVGLTPEDIERLRRGSQPRYRGLPGPISANPFMRPL